MHSKSTSIDTLPYEVIDLIFDEMESDIDPSDGYWTRTAILRTLAACRLQCKRLDNVACPRLFRTIDLTKYCEAENGATSSCEENSAEVFLGFINSNPHIISFVRSFSINTYAYRKRSCHWILKNKELPQILDRLATTGQLKHFAFNAFKGSLVWGKFNKRVSKSIETLCSIPSISRLDFRGILDLPGSITSRFNELKELRLMHQVTFQNPVGMLSRPGVSRTPSPLKSIEICPKAMSSTSTLDAVRHMGSVHLFTNIETLRWTIISLEELLNQHDYLIGNDQRKAAWDVCLNSVKETVKILDVGPSLFSQWTEVMSWPSAENLASIKRLEEIRLRIEFTANDSKNRPRTVPDIIHRFLRGQTPIPTVRVIHIRFQLPWLCTQIDMHLLAGGWSGIKLDEFVLETYPGLQELIFEFQPNPDPKYRLYRWEGLKVVEGEEFKDFMRENLPRVVESPVMLRVITPQLEVLEM